MTSTVATDVLAIDPTTDGGGVDVAAVPQAEPDPLTAGQGRRGGRGGGRGAEARRAVRRSGGLQQMKPVERRIPTFDLLSEESLATIEHNAETILEEIGIVFHDDEETLALWREAGADVSGERVRFPRGLCRSLLATAPETFVQHARNPERSVTIGGPGTVFAPVYGPPFVRDLEGGRRYGNIGDFRNLVKLTYATPSLHHSGGTVCEPVDLPVNKRHLDMVKAHLTLTDKPFMGSVTAPERAADTVEMARIVFGADTVDRQCVVINLINANSPLSFDSTMLGALKVYARAGQACIVTPFILAGAMAPVTGAGVMAQALAEAMAGMALAQLVRPGAPVVMGTFASSMSMQSGAPTFGTPEPALVLYGMAQLARRLKVPFRSGGSLCASKVPDAQSAYESQATLTPTVMAGTNFVLHAAGWLEGGLVSSFEKLVMDADQLGMMHAMATGVDMSENGQALDAIREVGPGSHFLGCSHTQANFETAFFRSVIADNNSFEQWEAEGAKDAVVRANAVWKGRLAAYEQPALDPGLAEALDAFVAERKASMPDRWV
ncbi:trimethylamine methyltransferase family protein [Fodinicurvata sp. EGI_FJ10296]|uniref:trimethylamine methyltransferase family protein n=1 Tax=Fodinicurvata sp. EGI_FJ10296 TaxID=3231908 RepID=UPI0034514858